MKIIVAIFLAIFIALSTSQIDRPGIGPDQLLFVNTAIGPLDPTWIYKTVRGVPIFIMAYIGALKGYIYKPIFYFFGVNIWSIRLPVILLMALALLFLYKAISLKVNKKIAIFTLILLCADPSFIAFSRIDNGPNVLEFFFKTLSLLFLFNFFKTKQKRNLFFLIISLALGLYNKANFIWFINSLFLGILIFYRDLLYKNLRMLFVSYLGFVLYGILIFRNAARDYKMVAISLSGLPEHISLTISNFIQILSGESFLRLVYGKSPNNFTTAYSILLILFNLFGLVYFIKNKNKIEEKIAKFYFFTWLAFVAILIQLFVTTIAVSPWHTYALYPFFTILTAVVIFQMQKKIKWAYLILIFIFLYNLLTYFTYLSYYQKDVKNLLWSDKFYDLVKFTDRYPLKVLNTDISIQANLLAFSKNYKKYTPLEWVIDGERSYESYKRLQVFFSGGAIAIVPNNEIVVFKDVQKNFFRYTKENYVRLTVLKEFRDGDKITYTVYKIN